MAVIPLGNGRYYALDADTFPTTGIPAEARLETESGVVWRWNGSSWQQVIGRTKTETLTNKSLTYPNIRYANTGKTANHSLLSSERIIRADATSGDITITLPTAATIDGRPYQIKKIDSSTNIVILATTSSQTIDGLLTWELRQQYDFVEVVSNGTNWKVTDYNTPTIHSYRRKGTTENRWYLGGMITGGGLQTGTPSANFIYATPLMITTPMTLNDMAINVTTAGAGGTLARLGVYKDKNNYPAELVVEAGEVATSNANTFQSVALGTAQRLQPGLYWLTAAFSGTPTIRYVANTTFAGLLGVDSTAGTTNAGIDWVHAFTYGALPSTFPTSSPAIGSAAQPAIYVRFI
jgi:hypothetical protein